jgi:hypothetical protein
MGWKILPSCECQNKLLLQSVFETLVETNVVFKNGEIIGVMLNRCQRRFEC